MTILPIQDDQFLPIMVTGLPLNDGTCVYSIGRHILLLRGIFCMKRQFFTFFISSVYIINYL